MVASTQPCAGQIRPLLGVSRSRCDQDVQELWVMDSFAFALSDGIWVRPSVANTQSHTHVPSYVPSYRSISDIISAQALNMIKIHQYTLPPLARVSSAISSAHLCPGTKYTNMVNSSLMFAFRLPSVCLPFIHTHDLEHDLEFP